MNLRTLVLSSVILTAACGGYDSSPSSSTAQGTPLGTYSQTDIRAGTGADAVNGRSLSTHYTLWLYDPTRPEQKGQQIQTSVGSTPYSFVLGSNGVIGGWNVGVIGMKVGGIRRLVLPPDLAYGSNPPSGSGIPPNATLVFDIELLSVS